MPLVRRRAHREEPAPRSRRAHRESRHSKRRSDPEDVEISRTTSSLNLFPRRTHEICGLLVHAELADDNFFEEELVHENVKEKIENETAGGLAC